MIDGTCYLPPQQVGGYLERAKLTSRSNTPTSLYRKIKDGRNTIFVERVQTEADFLSLGTDRIHSASGTVPSTPSPILSSGSSFMSEGHIVEPSRRLFYGACPRGVANIPGSFHSRVIFSVSATTEHRPTSRPRARSTTGTKGRDEPESPNPSALFGTLL